MEEFIQDVSGVLQASWVAQGPGGDDSSIVRARAVRQRAQCMVSGKKRPGGRWPSSRGGHADVAGARRSRSGPDNRFAQKHPMVIGSRCVLKRGLTEGTHRAANRQPNSRHPHPVLPAAGLASRPACVVRTTGSAPEVFSTTAMSEEETKKGNAKRDKRTVVQGRFQQGAITSGVPWRPPGSRRVIGSAVAEQPLHAQPRD